MSTWSPVTPSHGNSERYGGPTIKAATLIVALVWCIGGVGAWAATTVPQNVQDAVTEVWDEVKKDEKNRNLGELKLKKARLENELAGLKQRADTDPPNEDDKAWYAKALAGLAEAKKILDPPTVADVIKGTKPMTAVLFSSQDRNSFEVVKDPSQGPDATVGIINQSQAGGTGGILIAAEAPFAYPRKIFGLFGVKERRYPIGAWYGVNLKTGGNEDVSDVSLAAGLSFSLISTQKLAKIKEGEGAGLSGSARLLVGAVYGEVATLGPKNGTEPLKVGDPYPLGESPPLHKDKSLTFAFGLGFRF